VVHPPPCRSLKERRRDHNPSRKGGREKKKGERPTPLFMSRKGTETYIYKSSTKGGGGGKSGSSVFQKGRRGVNLSSSTRRRKRKRAATGKGRVQLKFKTQLGGGGWGYYINGRWGRAGDTSSIGLGRKEKKEDLRV